MPVPLSVQPLPPPPPPPSLPIPEPEPVPQSQCHRASASASARLTVPFGIWRGVLVRLVGIVYLVCESIFTLLATLLFISLKLILGESSLKVFTFLATSSLPSLRHSVTRHSFSCSPISSSKKHVSGRCASQKFSPHAPSGGDAFTHG